MNPKIRAFLSLLLIAVFTVAVVPAATAGRTKAVEIVDLGPVYPGIDGGALAVNKHGDVVGAVIAPNGTHEAFLYSHGAEINLGTLTGGSTSVAFGVNTRRHVVGTAGTIACTGHAFIFTNKGMEDLGTLGGSGSGAYAINDEDEIVGYATPGGDQEYLPVLWAKGRITALGGFGGNGMARDINKKGQSRRMLISDWQPKLSRLQYKNGVMSDLGTLGGAFSYARAINDRGEIVGYADPGNGSAHAFLYRNGAMTDLGTFGFTGSVAVRHQRVRPDRGHGATSFGRPAGISVGSRDRSSAQQPSASRLRVESCGGPWHQRQRCNRRRGLPQRRVSSVLADGARSRR